MIDPPKRQEDYPDRDLDCQQAMETMFTAMVEEMRAVGWREVEINKAIVRLIFARQQAMEEKAKTEAQIAIIRAMDRMRRSKGKES